MLKRIVIDDTEVEIKDFDPIERMRHRDTDGDGVADYIDSNGYSKPNDKYRYREISAEEFEKLRKSGFNVKDSCRPSAREPNGFILRYAADQTNDIDRIIKPVLYRTVK